MAACQMPNQIKELAKKIININIWIAKHMGKWQAKTFLDCQNNL